MNQLIITLKDGEEATILQKFLETLDYVNSVELLSEESDSYDSNLVLEGANEKLITEKTDYTMEDIETIVQQFPPNHLWTYQDLQAHFPEDLQIRVEILNHQLSIMPSPQEIYQEITFEVCAVMKAYVKQNQLGKVIISPFDVVLEDKTVVIPDVIFVAIDNLEILDGKRANGSPDLLVEVWSLGNSQSEKDNKRKIYEAKEVKEFWAITPKERSIKVEVLENGKYQTFSEGMQKGIIRSSVLKGFQVNIEDLMPDELFENEN